CTELGRVGHLLHHVVSRGLNLADEIIPRVGLSSGRWVVKQNDLHGASTRTPGSGLYTLTTHTPVGARNTMRILIANDDGIYSPGILALAQVAQQFGEVRIVAPDVERSSTGHAVTHSRPLSYRRTPIHGFDAFRVAGTPADCVALGTSVWSDV